MKTSLMLLMALLAGLSAIAQDKSASSTPPSVVTLIQSITDKRFLPDTAFASLSEDDIAILTKEPVANWGLAQESGTNMTYYNLVVGTRSYQLVIVRPPKSSFPTATLLRFTTPKSKPEPIARGTLRPEEEKPK